MFTTSESNDLSATQRRVMEFLADPASYGDPDAQVEQVVTHCSIIFLVGHRAYKLKRAIRFASVDYRSLALRRENCFAELSLNRRTAPNIYLEVRAINRDASGKLGFGGAGPAVDYVVVMRRFAQEDLLDRRLQAGRLGPEQMRELGHDIARFHMRASPNPAAGGSRGICRAIAENHRELSRLAKTLYPAAITVLHGHTLAALAVLAPLLDRRRDEGKVRHVHGDLRLANICIFDGRMTLFDCIEFDETLNTIDTLYDLAFLLMDLRMQDRADLAKLVLAGYQEIYDDILEPGLLPFFLSIRAATRGYALAEGAQRQADPVEAERRLSLARKHLRASHRFLRAALAELRQRSCLAF